MTKHLKLRSGKLNWECEFTVALFLLILGSSEELF